MAVDSRQKGARAEAALVKLLIADTGFTWKRTPGSGALHADHLLKGDCYIPGEHNLFVIEIKHYKDCHLTCNLLTDKNPQLLIWWEQAKRQGVQVSKKPILFFKHDRSKWFVALRKQDAILPKKYLHYMPEDLVICTYDQFKTYIMPEVEFIK